MEYNGGAMEQGDIYQRFAFLGYLLGQSSNNFEYCLILRAEFTVLYSKLLTQCHSCRRIVDRIQRP